MKKTDLNRVNSGGKHHENPLGGVMMGTGMNGKPNTVEEGETTKGDFVFSDTVKLTKDVIEQFNLPSNLEGKTVASATKLIDNKFKDRADKISMSTKTKMLDGIAAAQETIKAKQQNLANAFEANSTEVPDMMNGQVPAGFEEFAPQQNQMFLGGVGSEMAGNESGINPAAIIGGIGVGANLLNQAQGNTSTSGFNATLSGAASGAGIGSMFGPIGTGIGAAIGGGLGLFGSGKARDRVRAENKRQNILAGSTYQNDFALGGPTRPRVNSVLNPEATDELNLNNNLASQYYFNNISTPTATPQNILPTADTSGILPKANLQPAVNWLENNYGNVMRYAPVVGNALQLNNLKKPGRTTLNRLDNRFQPDYVDERTIQNIVGNEYDNVSNSLTGATNGSQGTLRSSLLGASLNRTKAMSDAYMNASAQNRNQNLQGQQFNLGVDQFNVGQSNQELDINDRNTAAYDNNKSRLQSALFNDIGNIGREEVYKKMAKDMFGYSWTGKYYVAPDGSRKTAEEVQSEIDTNATNKAKLGGMFLKNKRK